MSVFKWYVQWLWKYWWIKSMKNNKILIVFDMIEDMISNNKLEPIVIELFICGHKVGIS